MRQLRRVADQPVVLLRRGHHHPPEAQAAEEVLEVRKRADVRARRRGEDHGGVVKQRCRRMVESPVLDARHRVPADEGKAVFPGRLKQRPAHRALDAAQVDHPRALFERRGVLLYVGYRRAGPGGDEHDVADGQPLVGQIAVDGLQQPGLVHHLGVGVRAQHRVRGVAANRLCHGAADQPQAHHADVHVTRPPSAYARHAAEPRARPPSRRGTPPASATARRRTGRVWDRCAPRSSGRPRPRRWRPAPWA